VKSKIKICGLTRECDIDYVNEAGPEYLGFVFAGSRRQIDEAGAARLKSRIKSGIAAVGVFVNAPAEQIIRLMENGIIDIVQLHGQETPSYVEEIKRRANGPVIKAIRIGEEEYPSAYFEEYANAGTDYFLFDSGTSGGGYGGTGVVFDWNRIPRTPLPYFLAGGLHAENIGAALSHAQPYAVDISSGVETNGVKDRDKILEIIRRVRDV
jgi:phosphoribosylanthranilate isomerase